MRFACGGAVSGNWWDEADPGHRDTAPGFAVVDLHRDGTADVAYWTYREVGEREISPDGAAPGSRRAGAAGRGATRLPDPPPVLR